MENLRAHIDRLGISQNAFADRIGVSKGYLSQILAGNRKPSREMIEKIDVATGGSVPPAVWFKPNATGDAA
jgi:transcriptional regulator with XRE-family HTH domain